MGVGKQINLLTGRGKNGNAELATAGKCWSVHLGVAKYFSCVFRELELSFLSRALCVSVTFSLAVSQDCSW